MKQREKRKHVEALVRWAENPGDQAGVRPLVEPLENALIRWLHAIVDLEYFEGLWRTNRIDEEEFRQLCIIKLFKHVRKRPPYMWKRGFTDVKLRGVVRRLAERLRIDIWRKKDRLYFELIDEEYSLAVLESVCAADDEGESSVEHLLLNAYPALQKARERAPGVMGDFFRGLRTHRRETRTREILAAMLRYCRYVMKLSRTACYCLIMWILLRRQRLYKELRKKLAARFPSLKRGAVSSHVSILRKKFDAYLRERELYDWANWLVGGFAWGRDLPGADAA